MPRAGITCLIASELLPTRYTSATLLARGGMGEVYRATDTVLGRPVAIKVLAERHARDPDVRPRFEREALAAARLSGEPNVITVFDVGEHDGRPFIVMEYLEGGSVDERLRAARPERDQALRWLAQTARALDAAHAHGVVHRDVKPANLLLDRDGNVRVSDFGIAFAAGFDTLTLPGTVLGTAGYLSPEQARGEPATAQSDRYSLGVVAFELLTGRRPYEGDTPVTQALGHVNAPIPSASTIEPKLPAAADEVLARALAKSPEDRPRSCAELVRDLERAVRESTAPTLVAAPVVATTEIRRHRRHAPSAAYAVALAVVLLGGIGGAALVGAVSGDGSKPSTTPRKPVASTGQETTTTASVDGAALNDAGFALMQKGDYAAAAPLLRRAVLALSGSGTLPEAWASYNLAFTRFALGRCDGVLPLLDRSEAIQGHRRPIDELREDWEDACGKPIEDDKEDNRGKGKGNGNGRGKGGG